MRLWRQGPEGSSAQTNDKPLRLGDFINYTACQFPTKLLLNIPTVEIAEQVSDILKIGRCPDSSALPGTKYGDRAYLKLAAADTIPTSILDGTTSDYDILSDV